MMNFEWIAILGINIYVIIPLIYTYITRQQNIHRNYTKPYSTHISSTYTKKSHTHKNIIKRVCMCMYVCVSKYM